MMINSHVGSMSKHGHWLDGADWAGARSCNQYNDDDDSNNQYNENHDDIEEEYDEDDDHDGTNDDPDQCQEV